MRSSPKERNSILHALKKLVTTQMINMGRIDMQEWCGDVEKRKARGLA